VTRRILVDAGPLVAIFLSKDQHHIRCVEALANLQPPLFTCWPILAEAAYLLRRDRTALHALLNSFEGGFLRLLAIGQAELSRIGEIALRYGTVEAQTADAALVYLAERENIDTIFTIDRRDFSVYRAHGKRSFTILP
jgi:uncharacterized protein